jgi:hypothetical protein
LGNTLLSKAPPTYILFTIWKQIDGERSEIRKNEEYKNVD